MDHSYGIPPPRINSQESRLLFQHETQDVKSAPEQPPSQDKPEAPVSDRETSRQQLVDLVDKVTQPDLENIQDCQKKLDALIKKMQILSIDASGETCVEHRNKEIRALQDQAALQQELGQQIRDMTKVVFAPDRYTKMNETQVNETFEQWKQLLSKHYALGKDIRDAAGQLQVKLDIDAGKRPPRVEITAAEFVPEEKYQDPYYQRDRLEREIQMALVRIQLDMLRQEKGDPLFDLGLTYNGLAPEKRACFREWITQHLKCANIPAGVEEKEGKLQLIQNKDAQKKDAAPLPKEFPLREKGTEFLKKIGAEYHSSGDYYTIRRGSPLIPSKTLYIKCEPWGWRASFYGVTGIDAPIVSAYQLMRKSLYDDIFTVLQELNAKGKEYESLK
ncbi:MAG: hypothetical protein V1926_01570 [Candidatus Peregrinibacteria bacterium]